MSFLSGIFNNPNTSEVGYNSATQTKVKNTETSLNVKPGQTITGKITNMDDNGVTVKLNDGGTVTAKLDGNMNLSPGQMVTFSVKGNSDSQVTLSPLYTNLTQSPTAMNALTAANIPVSNQSLLMTDTMIGNGMPIDAKSLQTMFQQVNSFPEFSAQTIVQMKSYGLEVNEQNISSFQAFQNYESQITSGMNEILKGTNEMYLELVNGGKEFEAADFMKGVLNTFLTDNASAVKSAMDLEQSGDKIVLSEKTLQNTNENGNISNNAQNVSDSAMQEIKAEVQTTADKTLMDLVSKNPSDNAMDIKSSADEIVAKLTGESIDEISKGDVWKDMSFGNKAIMLEQLKNAGLDQSAEAKLLNENASSKDFLLAAQELLNKNGLKDSLKDLFASKEFNNILKDFVKEEWTLKPEQVQDKATVENLYQKLNEQVHKLTDNLSEFVKPDSMLGQSLSNMNQNMDFMNQMNQTFQYIQLPLKMNGTETTGDLFVYTDKKSLANKEGNVSALLHLDMANLGPLDVYASINSEKNVSTKFYLQDESMIDFIADNIHILNERLEKRGYHMKSEVVHRSGSDGRPATPNIPENKVSQKTIGQFRFNALA